MNGWLLSAHIIEPIYPTHPHVGKSILMPKFLVRTFDHENGMFESMVCISILQLFGHFRWSISKIQLLQKDKLRILVEYSKNLSIKLIIFSSEVLSYIYRNLWRCQKRREPDLSKCIVWSNITLVKVAINGNLHQRLCTFNIMHYRMVNRMLIMLGKAPSNPVRARPFQDIKVWGWQIHQSHRTTQQWDV